MKFNFKVRQRQGTARVANLQVGNKNITTPTLLMAAPTMAVHDLSLEDVANAGVTGLSVDSYIISENPGTNTIASLGGLHRFMNWSGLLIAQPSDFHHLALVKKQKLSQEGVRFYDAKTGAVRLMTPQATMDTQIALHPDMMVMPTQTPDYYATYDHLQKAVDINSKWAQLIQSRITADTPALLGTIQGAGFAKLRQQSVTELSKLNFAGYKIMGLSDIDDEDEFARVLKQTVALLPDKQIRMVGDIQSLTQLLTTIQDGVDLIETSLPTHWGHYGKALTHQGLLPVKKARFAEDVLPLDEQCGCEVCQNYSRAYLRHLLHMNEPVGSRLIGYHNLVFLQALMDRLRQSIINGTFGTVLNEIQQKYEIL